MLKNSVIFPTVHAYNTHISPSRSRSAAKSKSKSKSDPTSASTPLVTYSTQHTSHHYNYNHSSTTTTNGVGITTTSSASVIQIAETNPRPVLIQLAPPPPPRTRRKRVDAFAAEPGPGTSMPIRERSRTDVPRSVSISVSGTTTTSRFGDPSVRYSSEGDRIGLGDALDGLDAYSYSNPNSYTYQHQQHPGYDETTFNDVQNSAAAYNARRISQPITLTYEPPVMSGGLSMLETTETEGEAHEDEEDEDFEDVMEEDDMAGHEDGGIRVGMYMEDLEGDLALEDEMQKALSRSSSMATSMSGLSTGRRRGHARTHSMTKRHVAATGGTSGTKAASNKPKSSTKSKPKSKSSKAKKAAAEDPGMYIRKRGSMPIPPSATKRLFGFEFGWEHHAQGSANSLGAAVGRRGRRQSAGVVKKGDDVGEKGVERGQESSFMDLQGTGIGANASTAVAVAVGVTTRKLKRHSTPAGSIYARSVIGGGVKRKQEKWEEVFGIGTPQAPSVVAPTMVKMEKENGVIAAGMKKLKKKRSQSVTRPDHTDDVNPSARAGILPDLPVAKTSNSRSSALPNGMSSNSNFKIPASPSGPSTCDSGYGDHRSSRHANRASLGSGSSIRRGLQLKRSFKLSVGRTLGPGLTLASAGVGGGEEWEEHRRKADRERGDAERRERQSDETIPTDEDADVDVDGEIRSIAAARLVSASIARATPAATIVTAPSSAGLSTPSPPPSAYQAKPRSSPIDIAYPTLSSMQQGAGAARPVLPAIVTSPITIPIPTPSAIPFPLSAPASRRQGNGSSPDAQSPSRQQPHTSASTWMPHPFADAIEQPMPNVSSSKSYMTSASDGRSGASVDDDVVQLEREMEEIRGRRGNGANAMDSPTTQLREFAEMAAAQAGESMSICAPTPSPGLSSSMTPSVTSMFALAHAQAQNAAPAPPAQTQPMDKEKEKAKMKLFGGGHFQKRLALSSPPVSKSDWGPQSSGAGNTGSSGGFLYRFPMIFPNTFAGSPPDSRPAVNGGGNAQTNHPVPRPSTPRGGSTLRLSAMETVRSTFAIVGARMSNATSRMSVTSSTGASLRNGGGHGFGEMVLEDIDGDFMDLRDPFASPPPASNIATVAIPSSLQGRKHSGKVPRGDGDVDRNVLEEADALKRKMSTWGRLPMPASTSAAGNGSSTVSGTAHKRHSFVNGRPVVRVVGKPSSGHHRKHKKEKRSRKVTLPSMSSAMGPVKVGSPEDADFGLEEALLSQRLLNRLDSGDWESRV
ncbi:hypothetical protein JR316_0001815 [Psilocybe cubensis]|uniref:Uncharacterized protein n=2 Tax=Psilocybe cubensis TaxID=181762 RepID=A0ACB8HAD8_PSICU|nr:hypothetical protein JR316_0001815 [Psilocybe cubensis]KAH9484913.1 hypothetical protein JR316_0001815 [Psilocybe cubensis]